MSLNQRLSENQGLVNPSLNSSGSPSLVIYGHNRTWNRQQKRCYHRLRSFFGLVMGRKCQLLRVDLTTSFSGKPGKLREHLKELLKRVQRVWGYDVIYFCVETLEGNGVLHMVWAIKDDHAVALLQKWISQEWLKIHESKIVYVKRVNDRGGSAGRISKYFVSQYLAGQSALVRISWSWGKLHFAIGKAWTFLKSEIMKGFDLSTFMGRGQFEKILEYRDLLHVWNEILNRGWCTISNATFFISGRSLDVAYSGRGDKILRWFYNVDIFQGAPKFE